MCQLPSRKNCKSSYFYANIQLTRLYWCEKTRAFFFSLLFQFQCILVSIVFRNYLSSQCQLKHSLPALCELKAYFPITIVNHIKCWPRKADNVKMHFIYATFNDKAVQYHFEIWSYQKRLTITRDSWQYHQSSSLYKLLLMSARSSNCDSFEMTGTFMPQNFGSITRTLLKCMNFGKGMKFHGSLLERVSVGDCSFGPYYHHCQLTWITTTPEMAALSFVTTLFLSTHCTRGRLIREHSFCFEDFFQSIR